MTERFSHRFIHPFQEAGKKIKQVGNDIREGGRQGRLDKAGDFPLQESKQKDIMYAVLPGAGIGALLLPTLALVIEEGIELVGDVSFNLQIYTNPNWLLLTGLGIGGMVVGSILNAERSRRAGERLREEESEWENTRSEIYTDIVRNIPWE